AGGVNKRGEKNSTDSSLRQSLMPDKWRALSAGHQRHCFRCGPASLFDFETTTG
ncbi:hypothetical protein BaRGS_00003012, partial [Batillaria attramentaria]